jgi:Bacterial Ig-like domain (group 1)
MRAFFRHRHVSLTVKIVAAVFSALTAILTLYEFGRSYGLIGAVAPEVLTVGSLGVRWVSLTPSADTATALGDTLRFVATVSDGNGTALVGATIHWSSDDRFVAQPIGGGRVVARHPGAATVSAEVGDRIARAHVIVRQRVTGVEVNGDSVLIVGEDERRPAPLLARDAHHFTIPARDAVWRSLDTSVAQVDSAGTIVARAYGATQLIAEVDGVEGRAPVLVVPVPGAFEIVAGDTQRAAAGAQLARPTAVRLRSRHGQPMAGDTIHFRTAEGGGHADPATVVTDAHGIARTSWTLGPVAGRQRLYAVREDMDSVGVVVAEADPVPADTRLRVESAALIARVGETVAETLRVAATDTLGRALTELPVSWLADDGGTVRALGERTDSLGVARAIWTLGPQAGVQRARVRMGSGRLVPALVLRADAAAGPPAQVAIVAGDGQTGRVAAPLASPIALRVVDGAGNGVPGVELTLHATGGTLSDSALTSDSAGRARARWTLPRAPGTLRLHVRAAGVKKELTLTAHAVAAPPANLTFTQPTGAPIVEHALDKHVGARVTDVYGNPIAGVVVTFHARSGVAAPTRVATDADGVARTRWVLGAKPGQQTLTAAVSAHAGGASSSLVVTARRR